MIKYLKIAKDLHMIGHRTVKIRELEWKTDYLSDVYVSDAIWLDTGLELTEAELNLLNDKAEELAKEKARFYGWQYTWEG